MTAPLIDSHCHLADRRLREHVDAILSRASNAEVKEIVSVGAIESIETDLMTVAIAEKYPDVFAAIGVHPHNASDCDSARIEALRDLAKSEKVVAIGETGLDFHYMHSPAEAQEQSLRRHLELAAELKLPVIIHCRDAETRVQEIVREEGLAPAGGVIHCFTGDAAAAREFVELGFHVSFSGIITFKKAHSVREAAQAIPLDRLMVETDAPYLAPEPYRGKPNEPAFVRLTAEVLAEVRKMDRVELRARLAENTRRLFGLPVS